MISWIQRTFQQHFKIVFAALLFVTIVSFIMTIGAAPGIGDAGDKVATSDFFGHNLGTEMSRITNDATLSIVLQIGSAQGLSEDQVKNYALHRVAALHLADQLHLPATTTAAETAFIKGLRIFSGANGQFDPQAYPVIVSLLERNFQVSEDDIARVIRDDARVGQVQRLLDGPGYVLAGDVRDMLVRSDTLWTVATATVSYASFKPAINPTDADIAKFFQENSFRYEIPPRVVASYVAFSAASRVKDISVTDAEVRAYYEANRTRFDPPDAAPVKVGSAPKPSKVDYFTLRPKVEAALKLERAKNLATQAASDLGYAIYSDKVANGPALEAYLAARQLTLQRLAPFAHDAAPAELGGSPDIADAAFQLGADHYFSEALPTPGGAVILFWQETQPAHTPLLAEVSAKVRADYIEDERRQHFVALGQTLQHEIQASLKAGDSLAKAAAAAADASSVKIEVKTWPTFSLQTRPKELDAATSGALEHLAKGQLSDMALSADQGSFIYALDKREPNLSESNPRFAEMRAQLAAYSARSGADAFLTQIVDAELKRTAPAAR